MPTNRVALQIDAKPLIDVGSGNVGESVDSFAPPARTSAPAAPDNLQLSTGLSQADRSALAWIDATWDDPPSEVQSYSVQCATDTAFTENVYTRDARSTSIRIDGRKPATLYYVRVRANYRDESSKWSAASSITTDQDDTPPSQPSDTALSFATNADLVLVGTNPPEENFAQLEIIIRGSAVGPIYAVLPLSGKPGAAFRFVWPAAENVRLASGDGSLTVEVRAQNFAGFASAPIVLSANKNPPATPVVTTTWDARAGAVTFAWSSVSFGTYSLSIDGVPHQVQSPYTYDVSTNRKEHAGTASGSLAWSMVASDPLGQTSATASGTALLPRPDTPTSVVPVWDSYAGTWSISFGLVATANEYNLVIDGKDHKFFNDRFSYLVGTNRSEHGGNASASLVWTLVAIDGLDQTSATPASGTSTLAPPTTPTATTDFASATAVWNWNVNTGVPGYKLSIDGQDRSITGTSYSYDFQTNAKEHSSTATPSLLWSLVAVDGLGQQSAAAASTLVNAAPAAPTAINLVAGATGFVVSITHPTTLDLRDYTVRIIKDGSTVETLIRTNSGFNYMASGNGIYTVGVMVNDVFGQSSAEYVTPTGLSIDPLDMIKHRAGIVYSDSGNLGGSFADLWDDNRTSGGVDYAMWTGGWRWTQATRETASGLRNVRIAATGGVGYLGVQKLDDSWVWYSGPLGTDGQTLTQVVSEAAAQAAAISLPVDGLWTVPAPLETRTVRLGHRKTTAGNYTLREFFPRRYVAGEDIDGEVFRGFRFTGTEFVADTISGISAFLGTVQISGWATIGSAGGIWQGSSGTPTSPNTGLKIYLSGTGNGLLESWKGSVKQIFIDDADMGLGFGGGRGKLNASGLSINGDDLTGSSYVPSLAIRWLNPSSGEDRLKMFTYTWSNQTLFYTQALPATGSTSSAIFLEAHKDRTGNVASTVEVSSSRIQLLWSGSSFKSVTVDNSGVTLSNTTVQGLLTALSITSSSSIAASTTIAAGTNITAGGNITATGSVNSSANSLIAGLGIGSHSWSPGSQSIWRNGATVPMIASDSGSSGSTYIHAEGASGQIFFYINNSVRARISSAGNVVANAFYPGTQSVYYLSYRSDAPYLGMYTNGYMTAQSGLISQDDIYWGRNGIWISAWLNQSLLSTASPLFYGLTTSQTITIGSSLTVNNNNSASSFYTGIAFGGASGERISSERGAGTNQYGLDFWTASTAAMRISNIGNVSIGTTPGSSTRLLINSGGNTSSFSGLQVRNSDSTIDFQVFSDGNSKYRGTMTQISDGRLKRDIRWLETVEVDPLDQVGIVSYTRDGSDRRQRGVIAQALRKVFPDLVYEYDGFLSVDYIGFIPLLISKVQQLSKRLSALESRFAA